MKKLWFISILILIGFTVAAQDKYASKEDIEKFFKTKTFFVLDENMFNDYNDAMKEAAKSTWTITPFDFMSTEEFTKQRKNPNYSFIVRTKVTFGDAKDKKDDIPYTFISLLNGKNSGGIAEMPDLAEFPVSYYDVDLDKYDYKLGAILLFLQNHMQWMKDNPEVKEKNIIGHYRNQKLPTKNKTLYLIKEELPVNLNTEEQIAKVYSGKVKIVEPEEITKAIEEKNQDVIFLHKVGPGGEYKAARCFKLILGAADAKIYYFDFHNIKEPKKPNAFLKSDFEAIEKQ
jgi:hypothetical protein